jgi:indolepyruvate ferredoxin oxidoreductase
MTTVTLDDKYTQSEGRVYLTGSQALVRLPMMQRARDLAEGLNTAGYISGYRGSPLGIYDLALWQAERHLKDNQIHFQPGVNEDLAATSVWGSQQAGLLGDARYDGVFAMWYGKGPGVDRSGDPLKHGNVAGAAAKGGVLVLCGDDHAARSSTVAHQSDQALIHFGIPILHPASVQEYLDYGLFGFALSRYSGCWVGFKCVTDTVETSASVLVDQDRVQIATPGDFVMPPGGLNIRLGVFPLQAERQLFESRLAAAQAFVRANGLDQLRLGEAGNGRLRLGIVTTGKSYLDVIESLRRLGVDQARAETLGIAVYKVAMVWPLEPVGLAAFARRCEEILVVEEKRDVIESQVARILYNLPAEERPRLVGKQDEAGMPLLSTVGELDPDRVMQVVAARYLALTDDAEIRKALGMAGGGAAAQVGFAAGQGDLMRLPSFCAGCPHNTSTRVPEGSKALGGIGCHGLATWMPDRQTVGLCQMGGEGATWIGQAAFVETPHIFQNLGDGTYFHSGLLAVRACVAAGVNITYKILLNGAVGMTGGQPIEGERFEGEMTAPHVAAQLYAEGIKRIAVVSDDPAKFGDRGAFPQISTFHHRDELDAVQRELRELKGVSALIYDQACATERRRLRKRGKVPDPDTRLFIHPDVCEGCGDCGVQSNCIAIEPEETALGRKRRINQSVCNKDYSCIKGFCPSFVTVTGGKLRAAGEAAGSEIEQAASLLAPTIPEFDRVFSILVGGIGGNGVVTVAAILGMAAHIEKKPCTVLDISGLAQRNGAVMSHLRFSPGQMLDQAARIPAGGADLVIGCDLVVAGGGESLGKMRPGHTAVVYNHFIAPTSAFTGNPDLDFSGQGLIDAISAHADPARLFGADATGVAVKVLGNAIGANLFLVGFAWQKGLIPLSAAAIEGAIDLNGTSVSLNRRAFALGRLAADDPRRIAEWTGGRTAAQTAVPETLEVILADRTALLRDYQNQAYADGYLAFVAKVQAAEERITAEDGALSRAVARVLARLMAYKDEYEVGRLFASSRFRKHLAETFDGDFEVAYNLAPPLIARMDPRTGRPRKLRFGKWMETGFAILARLKVLRGTPLDLFGYSAHRRMERALITEYLDCVERLIAGLDDRNYGAAVAIAERFGNVRGFGVVKEQALAKVRRELDALTKDFEAAGKAAASNTAEEKVGVVA